MLVFNASKNKKIQMMIESTGISNDKLKFRFVIDTDKVEYGFPCLFNEGRVEVDIPPLEDIITNIQSGTYKARLDVTGDDKYYLNPFNESIQIELTPSIKKVDVKSSDVSEELKLAVSSLIEIKEAPKEEVKEEKKEVVKEKKESKKTKKSGISSFFDKK